MLEAVYTCLYYECMATLVAPYRQGEASPKCSQCGRCMSLYHVIEKEIPAAVRSEKSEPSILEPTPEDLAIDLEEAYSRLWNGLTPEARRLIRRCHKAECELKSLRLDYSMFVARVIDCAKALFEMKGDNNGNSI